MYYKDVHKTFNITSIVDNLDYLILIFIIIVNQNQIVFSNMFVKVFYLNHTKLK